jgi:predicted MFS family arabinose efflux permease
MTLNTPEKLPWAQLSALFLIAFCTLLTELLPTSMLPEISKDLGRSASQTGMLVSYYALASALVGIPIITFTRGFARKPLLITGLFGTMIANAMTALSTHYSLTVVVRFIAGLFAGLVWPLLMGYAARVVSHKNIGRSVAITLAGGTVAMSIGLPICALIAQYIGWRTAFGLLATILLLLGVWVIRKMPSFPGEVAEHRLPLTKVFCLTGIPTIVIGSLIATIGQYSLYTYIAPLVIHLGLYGGTSFSLFIFGMGAMMGVTLTGKLIQHHLKTMTFGMLTLVTLAMLIISLLSTFPIPVFAALFFWGMSFGSCPILCQTALNNVAGKAIDVAASILGTAYSIGIFGGAFVGSVLLNLAGITALPWMELTIFAVAFAIFYFGRQVAFPARVS